MWSAEVKVVVMVFLDRTRYSISCVQHLITGWVAFNVVADAHVYLISPWYAAMNPT